MNFHGGAIKKILLKKGINAAGKSGLEFTFDGRDRLCFMESNWISVFTKSVKSLFFLILYYVNPKTSVSSGVIILCRFVFSLSL